MHRFIAVVLAMAACIPSSLGVFWAASRSAAPLESRSRGPFRVVVFPVITGSSGRDRIYEGYSDASLDMVSSRTFDDRIQLLEYIVTVLAGPPGITRADA
jgi:hypothetical protein